MEVGESVWVGFGLFILVCIFVVVVSRKSE